MPQSPDKYTGKVKVGSGPVPLQRWSDKDRVSAREDMRMEERKSPHPKENFSALPTPWKGYGPRKGEDE